MGLDIDLYTPKIDIGDDGADDIIIEITGLKSISKFIGLEDTPLYYDNGKFFKVEDNKIVYTDIQWKDISGNLEDAPEIVAFIKDLVEEISTEIVDDHIYLHNIAEDAHPYIQNIIHENYVTLDTKIDDTKEELSQDISNLNDALNQEISDRETADNALSEDIQEEILARIDGDATLQGEIDTLNTNLQNEIDARIEGDTNLSNSLDELSNNLIQEVLDRQEQDGILQEQITSNYNTLDDKIDTEISNRTSADTTLQNNIDAEVLARQNADTTLQNNIDELTQTVEDNNTAVNNRIDETNDTVSDLSDTVTSNYNTLDDKIDTEISNRTSADTTLQNNIDTEASTRQNADTTLQGNIDTLSDTVSSNYNNLSNQISNLSDTVSDNYIDLDGKISDLTDTVNDNNTAINNKVDGINTTLTTSINNLSTTVSSNYTTLDTKIDNTKTSLEGDISDLSDTVSQNYTDLNNAITTSASTINSRIDSEVLTLNTTIGTETTNRQNADNNLQSQIDAIVSSSDVFDIVGTYAELQAYDISIVPVNDIIKVLVDSSHDNSATYYRCVETAGVKSWSYIGSEGAYYTKSESDTKFVAKTTTINNKPLSSNITLTASDVNALPNTTVIGEGILTLQKNGVNIDTFNANATANKSINITVPTDTADLTNGAGFITASSLPTVNNGTLTIQANGTTVGTFTANQSGNTTANIIIPDSATWGNITGTLSDQTDLQNALNGFVTLNTAQNISGRKTFLGEKAIYFKQNTTADKLGFTLYNPNNTELGALEWRPNTINGNALLALNCPQSGTNYVGFRYWGNINIVAPKPTTNGNYFIPINFTDGTNTVTANNNGLVDLSSILPSSATWGNITGTLSDQTDLASVLNDKYDASNPNGYQANVIETIKVNNTALTPDANKAVNVPVPTDTGDLTNNAGFITSITSNDVITALGYTPYNSSNPNGYTSNIGTVTSVNNVSPINGNVTLNIPSEVTESTVSGWGFTKNVGTVTSVNSILPDSNGNVSIPISGAPTWGEITGNISDQTDLQSALDSKLQNKATGTGSLNIIGNATNYARAISIGAYSYVPTSDAIAIGYGAQAKSQYSMAIGGNNTIVGTGSTYATALGIGATVDNNKTRAIQIGEGTNSTQKTLQIGFGTNYNYTLLDGTTGLIPDARISTNIARTSAIPTVNDATLTIQKNGTTVETFTANASTDVTANITVPTKISDLTDDTATYPIDKADTLTGLTSSIAELNILDGAILSTTELNYVDGVTSNIQTQLDNKLANKPDGTNNLLDSNNKINTTYVPDVLLGQMLYAGTFVPSTAVATLSTNAKTKLGTTSNTITLTNNTTAITGYKANEGCYYICSADGSFASISFLTGDWLISTGSAWQKIDNTDAVTGVKGNAESSYRTGNVNITADNVLPAQSSNSGKFLTTNGSTASWAETTKITIRDWSVA